MDKQRVDSGHLDAQETGLSRRAFLGAVGALGVAGALGACSPQATSDEIVPDDEGSPGSANSAADDWLGSTPEIQASQIAEARSTDLLIIGAGNGGLVAAATAAQEGIDFILAEKGTAFTEDRHWIGAVNTRYTQAAGLHVDSDRLLFELSRYASYKCDQRVIKVWIEESAALIDWLETIMGEGFVFDTEMGPEGPYYIPPIQHMFGGLNGLRPQEGWLGRNGSLEKVVTDAGYTIAYEHCLEKLLREGDGPVTGAVFSTADGSYIQIDAKNTILATGGYAANKQMIEALIPIVPRCCTAISYNPANDGYGLKSALWIGAQKDIEGTAMIFDRGAVPPGMPAGYEGDTLPGPIMQFNFGSQPFLKVDLEGRRFANESTPYDFITHAAATRRNGTYVQVFDANAAADITRFQTVGCSKVGPMMLMAMGQGDPAKAFATETELGAFMQADTLEELAQKLQLPEQTFIETVERYNELFDKQIDEDFGKEPYRLSSLRTPPYFGVTLGGSLLTTIDGLCINADMQVLDKEDKVIEGLYAVGDVSGRMFSGNYPELIIGSACGRTLTFGRHAALHIAGKTVA
jgi:succinate dehydrogenase/fumarate reductase flavoprotein subunit